MHTHLVFSVFLFYSFLRQDLYTVLAVLEFNYVGKASFELKRLPVLILKACATRPGMPATSFMIVLIMGLKAAQFHSFLLMLLIL